MAFRVREVSWTSYYLAKRREAELETLRAAQGRSDEAKAIFERVARFSPNLAEAQKTAESLLSGK